MPTSDARWPALPTPLTGHGWASEPSVTGAGHFWQARRDKNEKNTNAKAKANANALAVKRTKSGATAASRELNVNGRRPQ